MKSILICAIVSLYLIIGTNAKSLTKSSQNRTRSIGVSDDSFMLDGEPFHFVSGSAHYFRIPHQLWRDRLKKLRAAGLRAVSTYVEWSFHEPEEGLYLWDGDQDLVKYIQMAEEEGLLVLLRPGPYICAERDLGGFPYWLLTKYPNIKLRTKDANYMYEVAKWYNVLFEKINLLLYGNGGPIILVQVENEYGSYFEQDYEYMRQLRDLTKKHVGDAALLYTTDGAGIGYLKYGAVNDTVTTVDFGAGVHVPFAFGALRHYYPNGPLMNSEFYPGWLTHWGEKFQRKDTESIIKTLKQMLIMKANVNIYVFHGGTNFEFSAGANMNGETYVTDITSYDYDAPISEAGDITDKYLAIKKVLKKFFPETGDIQVPPNSTKASYGSVELKPVLKLFSPLGRKELGVLKPDVVGAVLPTFESLKQRAGLVLYETTLTDLGEKGNLLIDDVRDYAYIYVDGEYAGYSSREFQTQYAELSYKNNSVLSILVENEGRINFGNYLKDFKGLLSDVKVGNKSLSGKWTITGYPLEDVSTAASEPVELPTQGPIILQGELMLDENKEPADTFIDTSAWKRGFVWINGKNLGRFWPSRKTQITLYVPGVYLKPGKNVIKVLELENVAEDPKIKFIDHPIFN